MGSDVFIAGGRGDSPDERGCPFDALWLGLISHICSIAIEVLVAYLLIYIFMGGPKNTSWSPMIHLIWRVWLFYWEDIPCLCKQSGIFYRVLKMIQWGYRVILVISVPCVCQWFLLIWRIFPTWSSLYTSWIDWEWWQLWSIQVCC